jgi:hypothetical protein
MESGLAWIELLQGAGPWPHALLSTLGPALKRQLAAAVEREMAGLGDDALRYHEAFIFVCAAVPSSG